MISRRWESFHPRMLVPPALVCGISAAALLQTTGCREVKPKPEVISLSGKVEKIERVSDETGTITVTYYSEKQQQEIAGTGVVTKETEIMINGAVAKLKDLREGDRVSGEVRVEKSGKERKQVAIRIHVDRPNPAGG